MTLRSNIWSKFSGDSKLLSQISRKIRKQSTGVQLEVLRSDASYKMGKETGTMIELWQMAIGLFPEIVEQYGEFSSEMLQVMLGIPVEAKGSSITELNERSLKSEGEPRLPRLPIGTVPPKSGKDAPLTENTSFEVGQHVDEETERKKIVENEHRYNVKCDELPALETSPPDLDLRKNFQHSFDKESVCVLIEPDAPLIQKMRRCERRLLPLLNRWDLVDVALTEYELVYFDATDTTTLSSGTSGTNSLLQHNRDLISTKGGRDMLLREVTLGRRIVGHFDLRRVNFVKVQRRLCHSHPEAVVTVGDNTHLIAHEYWEQKSNGVASEEVTVDPSLIRAMNKKRWDGVVEDQLHIFTVQCILQLRFLCDLQEQEANLTEMSTYVSQNSEALEWGKVLAELRDKSVQGFEVIRHHSECELEVVSRDRKSTSSRKSWKDQKINKGHRRRVSAGHIRSLSGGGPDKFVKHISFDA